MDAFAVVKAWEVIPFSYGTQCSCEIPPQTSPTVNTVVSGAVWKQALGLLWLSLPPLVYMKGAETGSFSESCVFVLEDGCSWASFVNSSPLCPYH